MTIVIVSCAQNKQDMDDYKKIQFNFKNEEINKPQSSLGIFIDGVDKNILKARLYKYESDSQNEEKISEILSGHELSFIKQKQSDADLLLVQRKKKNTLFIQLESFPIQTLKQKRSQMTYVEKNTILHFGFFCRDSVCDILDVAVMADYVFKKRNIKTDFTYAKNIYRFQFKDGDYQYLTAYPTMNHKNYLTIITEFNKNAFFDPFQFIENYTEQDILELQSE